MGVIVTADGSRTLSSSTFGETYGSRHGALTEALHVFLDGSGVRRRLEAGHPTSVLEIGFGTGLNFLVTSAAAEEHGMQVRYRAIERDPLDAATLREVYTDTTLPARLVGDLVDWVGRLGAPLAMGTYTGDIGSRGAVALELVIGEAREALSRETRAHEVRSRETQGHDGSCRSVPALPAFDAIYLDAFSPKANPELWTPEFLAGLAARLHPGGTLVTFSVSGAVRRALTAAGLTVGKVPGPPRGKPEMLAARRPDAER
ncbi:MAG TPA: tRNA (5-methylaminomethyl-2-thiouridine)(34)-methyltransferase MnmD [Trueperaceae bacterium]|nr:tRNA (5-methylaminomethyl-2-thiouridine)(34)-methyltransferase MnmD [Trueperaceae bacterium]